MEERKLIKTKPHNMFIEGREKLNITGVRDVVSFDESTIVLNTEMGGLILKGIGLHINKLNVEDGNLNIEGYITAYNYTDKTDNKKTAGFFSNIFK
ncbi:MAG: sporulation protein YabP [Clostridia bacterium]|jgi:sporulation protein YabP|nr:sporulation protein YabP [Clostridia bacterium]